MGGQGSGGSREGKQGKVYTNRTDLAAQRSLTPKPAVQPAVQPQGQLPPPAPNPINVTPLDAPSANPLEDPMSGAPIGPGPGPEGLGIDPEDDVRAFLYALYDEIPSAHIAALLDDFEANG